MINKTSVILLCLLFLFTWTIVPDAVARERRGGGFDWTPTVVVIGVIAIVGIIIWLARGSSPQKETLKIQDEQGKADAVAEQNSLEHGNIEDAISLSFKF